MNACNPVLYPNIDTIFRFLQITHKWPAPVWKGANLSLLSVNIMPLGSPCMDEKRLKSLLLSTVLFVYEDIPINATCNHWWVCQAWAKDDNSQLSSKNWHHGILLLQTNTLALLLHLHLPHLFWSSSLPLALHFKLQRFSQNMPIIPINYVNHAFFGKLGTPGGNRTHDIPCTRGMLYHCASAASIVTHISNIANKIEDWITLKSGIL